MATMMQSAKRFLAKLGQPWCSAAMWKRGAAPAAAVTSAAHRFSCSAGHPRHDHLQNAVRPFCQRHGQWDQPLGLLDELRELGECSIKVDQSAIPSLDMLVPRICISLGKSS